MRLHYNLLWVDNDVEDYRERGAFDEINDYLSDFGFQGNIVSLLGEDNLETTLAETQFDLILSDYELDNTTGLKVVETIRNQYLTEILFYTAKEGSHSDDELRKSLMLVDRITIHLGRDTLIAKIQSIIKLTLGKLLELNATRGLITSETSELDTLTEMIVLEVVNHRLKLDKDGKEKIVTNYSTETLEAKAKQFLATYAEIGFDDVFSSIEANRKWGILRSLLKDLRKINAAQEITDFLAANKTYYDQVIDIRNKFAHARQKVVDGKTVLAGQYGKEDFAFDEDRCIEVRKNLIAHRENIHMLMRYLDLE